MRGKMLGKSAGSLTELALLAVIDNHSHPGVITGQSLKGSCSDFGPPLVYCALHRKGLKGYSLILHSHLIITSTFCVSLISLSRL